MIVNALPKRVRFYHAKIDAETLKSGEDYGMLKKVYVIFIMLFDPFGLNRMVYTIKNSCVEEPEQIIELLEKYPKFRPMYEQVYEMCRSTERVMGMFSRELKELDDNTVEFMIDELKEMVDKEKVRAEEEKKRADQAEIKVEEAETRAREAEEEKQRAIKEIEEEKQQALEELKKKYEELLKHRK